MMKNRYTDIWQDVEKSDVYKKIQEKKVRLKPENVFSEFIYRIEHRIHLEEEVREKREESDGIGFACQCEEEYDSVEERLDVGSIQ